uniref:Secreted protein n=1 Tax=Pyxicephalus adspersus TaxID=30357 RepID=A0AAV3ATX7_PYXAD|nr:TPA: hypothetical protein GDO54_009193 [Pyxicephalus adspersus]
MKFLFTYCATILVYKCMFFLISMYTLCQWSPHVKAFPWFNAESNAVNCRIRMYVYYFLSPCSLKHNNQCTQYWPGSRNKDIGKKCSV